MPDKIRGFARSTKLIIGLLLLAMICYASYLLRRYPRNVSGDLTKNQVQVITVAPSFSDADIETQVTFPIEKAINRIAGVKK